MNLDSTYMGIALRSPLLAAASPLSHDLDGIRRLADAGVGAVVLHSLFEEELRQEAVRNARLADAGAESFPEALSYFPNIVGQDAGPRRHLSVLERAAATVEVPVIASLNGSTPEGWTGYARSMQDAGAAAIELNVHRLPGDPSVDGREVERRHIDVLQRVKEAVSIPVAVKLSPSFSSIGEVALQMQQAGADGLVLFNRFLAPDIDHEALAISSTVTLSSPADGRLPRTWIALLHGRVDVSLAASGGVQDAADVARHLLAGADVVMSASALLRHGPGHATVLLDGLVSWMRRKGFHSVEELRGMLSVAGGVERAEYEREGYVRALRMADLGLRRPR